MRGDERRQSGWYPMTIGFVRCAASADRASGVLPRDSVVPSKTGRTPSRPVQLAGDYFSLKSALMADPSSVVSVTV